MLRQARAFWPQLTVEKLQEELEQIQQFVLLYPALGGGPHRTTTGLATQSLVQKSLADTLGLQQLALYPTGVIQGAHRNSRGYKQLSLALTVSQ